MDLWEAAGIYYNHNSWRLKYRINRLADIIVPLANFPILLWTKVRNVVPIRRSVVALLVVFLAPSPVRVMLHQAPKIITTIAPIPWVTLMIS